MSNYAELFNPGQTPQTEQIPGVVQVQNNAGGYVFELDKWARLRRFLILGSDSATYYQNARDLTRENALCVIDCWKEDARRTADLITKVSHEGLAPKNDPAIFALALGSTLQDPHWEARRCAFEAVRPVCRTGTYLFMWMSYRKQLGGGDGRGFKRAVGDWYSLRPTNKLALQAIKYRSREGWTHGDALRVHHRPMESAPGVNSQEVKALCQWMLGKWPGKDQYGPLPDLVEAHIAAMAAPAGETAGVVRLIEEFQLPWEALPTWALTSAAIWDAMVPHMGLTALIRRLGAMTACNAITQQHAQHVVNRLDSTQDLRKSRVHPFSVLQALAVYRSGRGEKGKKTWVPVARIIDVLDSAFYKAFENVESTGKRIMLALDVSGSMDSPMMGSSLTAREAAAAMAMVTLAREPNAVCYGFTNGSHKSRWFGVGSGLTPLMISPRQRLDDVVNYMRSLPMGGTDCALPFVVAKEQGMQFDAFVTYTDNETWAGNIHPVQALRQYRQASQIAAKSVVAGMTSTGFSIADPDDGGMMDVVGFDASAPAVISDFIGGLPQK